MRDTDDPEPIPDRASVRTGDLLRGEIERRFGSVADFLRDCDPEHGDLRDVTYRALRRQPIRYATLQRIARAVGADDAPGFIDEIVSPRRSDPAADRSAGGVHAAAAGVDVTGDWIGADIDFCPVKGLYFEIERASLTQIGSTVAGTTRLTLPLGGELAVEFRDAVLDGRVLTGRLAIRDWPAPDGLAVACMLLKSNDRVLDGHITWFDPDEGAVRCSRIIWVREDAYNRSELLAWTRKALVEEYRISLMRRLIAGGLGFEEATQAALASEPPEFDPG